MLYLATEDTDPFKFEFCLSKALVVVVPATPSKSFDILIALVKHEHTINISLKELFFVQAPPFNVVFGAVWRAIYFWKEYNNKI